MPSPIQLLIAPLGPDYQQWKSLHSVMLKNMFRFSHVMRFGTAKQAKRNKTKAQIPLTQVLILTFLGACLACTTIFISLTSLASLTVLAGVMLITAFLLLLECPNTILIAEEYDILAHQPVKSEVYFAAKLTSVICYVESVTLFLGVPCAITFYLTSGLLLAATQLAALIASSIFVTFVIIGFYVSLLRISSARTLGYVFAIAPTLSQLALVTIPLTLSKLISSHIFSNPEASDIHWILLFPPYWFSSWLDIVSGNWFHNSIIGACLGLVCSLGLFWLIRNKLSLSYMASLGRNRTGSQSVPKKHSTKKSRFGVRLFPAELQVISKLIASHIKNDATTQNTIATIIPIALLLLVFVFIEDITIPDPFIEKNLGMGLTMFHYFMLFIPAILVDNFRYSKCYQAAWIFLCKPVDPAKLSVYLGLCIIIGFLVPYVIFNTLVLIYFYTNDLHAVLHMIFMGLLTSWFLQWRFLAKPVVPFSQQNQFSKLSIQMFIWILVAYIIAVYIIPSLIKFIYQNIETYLWTILVMVLVNMVSYLFVLKLAQKRTRIVEFTK